MNLKSPYSVTYDPYTQTVEVLDNMKSISHLVSNMRGQLYTISDALNKMQNRKMKKKIPLEQENVDFNGK